MDCQAISIALATAIVVYIGCRAMYHIGYMARVREEKSSRGIK